MNVVFSLVLYSYDHELCCCVASDSSDMSQSRLELTIDNNVPALKGLCSTGYWRIAYCGPDPLYPWNIICIFYLSSSLKTDKIETDIHCILRRENILKILNLPLFYHLQELSWFNVEAGLSQGWWWVSGTEGQDLQVGGQGEELAQVSDVQTGGGVQCCQVEQLLVPRQRCRSERNCS